MAPDLSLVPLLNVLLSPPAISDEGSPDDDLCRFTEAETRALQQYRRKANAFEQKRAKLLRQLRENEIRIAKEKENYGMIYNASSAVSIISDDILTAIFWIAFEERKTQGAPPFFLPEVVISHVCSRWRALSLSMPRLWSFFCYGSDYYRSAIRVDRLEAYLWRSKQHPLDLWFSLPDNDHPALDQFQNQVLPLIVSQSHRWRRCQFMTIHQETVEKLSAFLPKVPTAPALEVLIPILTDDDHIVNHNAEVTTVLTGWSPNIFLSGAPKLEFLQLDEISVRLFRPPLQSIVHLRLEIHQELSFIAFSCSTLDDILVLPHLESLSIWGEYIKITQESFHARTSTIAAKKLKHFRSDGHVLPHYFLSHVAAPALETFAVYNLGLSNYEHVDTTPRFPSMRTVCLYGFHPDSRHIRRLMEIFSLLSTSTMLVMSNLSSEFALELKGNGMLQYVEELIVEDADLEPIRDAVSALHKLKKLTIPSDLASELADLEKKEWADRKIDVLKVDRYSKPHSIYPLWPPGVEWMTEEGQEGWGTGHCDYDPYDPSHDGGYF